MKDKVVIITGGFGALGREVAEVALERGAKVAALDLAPTPPPALKEGGGLFPLGGVDLATAEGAAKAIKAVAEKFGRIDALVNIAGGFRWETVTDGTPDSWMAMYKINVLTALHATRAALPHLLKSGAGRIVNIGANGALRSAAGMGAYAAAKSGVHRLTESLAEELKGKGVTVNAVLPSIIDTPANRADMPDADPKKWVRPADLAAVILFLASDESRAVTGALIPVMGEV